MPLQDDRAALSAARVCTDQGDDEFANRFRLCVNTLQREIAQTLIDTGGLAKKDRITHRMEITSTAEIDAEVKKWLKTAYDLDT